MSLRKRRANSTLSGYPDSEVAFGNFLRNDIYIDSHHYAGQQKLMQADYTSFPMIRHEPEENYNQVGKNKRLILTETSLPDYDRLRRESLGRLGDSVMAQMQKKQQKSNQVERLQDYLAYQREQKQLIIESMSENMDRIK